MKITSYTENNNVPIKIKKLIEHCRKLAPIQELKIVHSESNNDPPHIICFGADMTFRTGMSGINMSDNFSA